MIDARRVAGVAAWNAGSGGAANRCAGFVRFCDNKNKYAAPPPAKVTVATPIQMPVTIYAEFTGNTASVAIVDLEARVQGFLTSIGYRDGEAVAKGRVLFEIEKDQYQAQVDLQAAQLAAAKAKRTNAEVQYKRAAALGKDEFASQRAGTTPKPTSTSRSPKWPRTRRVSSSPKFRSPIPRCGRRSMEAAIGAIWWIPALLPDMPARPSSPRSFRSTQSTFTSISPSSN